MKKLTTTIFAGFLLFIGSFSIAQARFTDFAEIPSWAEKSVNLVQEKKIMTGLADGSFQPSKNLNRAEVLTMIFRLKGIDPKAVRVNTTQLKFPDVPADAWFAKAVAYATEQGWVKGFPDGNFHPEKEVNKAELAALLQRVFNLQADDQNPAKFSDVPEDAWFKDAVWALYNNDLVRHKRALKFFPANPVPRAEAAWIFAEILQKPRLMGTSREANYKEIGRARSSHRVAFRRHGLNVNKQGYDIEKAGVYVNVYDKIGEVEMHIGSDWVEVGNVILENKLKEDVTLDTISFKMMCDTAVGPARNFQLRMLDDKNEKTDIDFPRNGTIFLTDWDKKVRAGEEYKFKVFVRAKNVTGYYPKAGKATVYISDLQATALGKNSSGHTIFKKAPIIYKSRNFQDIHFVPTVE